MLIQIIELEITASATGALYSFTAWYDDGLVTLKGETTPDWYFEDPEACYIESIEKLGSFFVESDLIGDVPDQWRDFLRGWENWLSLQKGSF